MQGHCNVRHATCGARLNARGRSALLSGLVLFAALQAAYHFPVTQFWPQLHDGEYGHKLANLRAQTAARRAAVQPCVVMLGSSLTGWGFNPSALAVLRPGAPGGPVVFNLALNSGGVVVELLCLRRLLADGIRPDLVLVETHPWFLFRRYNVLAGPHYLPVTRLQFQDVPALVGYDDDPCEFLAEWAPVQCLPWHQHRHDLQNFLVPDWVLPEKRTDVWNYTDRHGWEGGLDAIPPRLRLSAAELRKATQIHLDQMAAYRRPDETARRAYRAIVDLCREEQIPVVLVRMPEPQPLRGRIPPALRDMVENFYADLVQDTGVEIVDARSWLADDDFRDGFHMTPEGSVVFTRRLERECLLPFLAGHTSATDRAAAGPEGRSP